MIPHSLRRRACYFLPGLHTGLTSCVSSKEFVLFQKTTFNTLAIASRFGSAIQIGVVLSVQVSSLNSETSSYFNPYTLTKQGNQMAANRSNPALVCIPDYLRDTMGQGELALMGKTKMGDLTILQAANQSYSQETENLKEPTVTVATQPSRLSYLD